MRGFIMPNADARDALRDAIRRDVRVRKMSYADVAQKHHLTIPSVNVALDYDEINVHKLLLTQVGSNRTVEITVLAPRSVSFEQVAENWRLF
jgi:hypothetical protein